MIIQFLEIIRIGFYPQFVKIVVLIQQAHWLAIQEIRALHHPPFAGVDRLGIYIMPLKENKLGNPDHQNRKYSPPIHIRYRYLSDTLGYVLMEYSRIFIYFLLIWIRFTLLCHVDMYRTIYFVIWIRLGYD